MKNEQVDEQAIYEALIAAAAEGDEDQIREILEEAKEMGVPLSLEEDEEEADWTEDYPVVVVNYSLKLGNVTVAEWQKDYTGFWGGGGSDWWIDVMNDETPEDVDFILECADLKIRAPYVPSKPPEEDSEPC